MTRYVKFTCKKCGINSKIDIGTMTKEQAIEALSKWEFFECPGHHVEGCSPLNFWEIDWSSIEEKEAETIEAWKERMTKSHGQLYDHDQVSESFTITGFAMGNAYGTEKATGKDIWLDFAKGPDNRRYYWCM